MATLRKFVAWLKKNNLEPSDVMGFTPDGQVLLKPITQRANYKPDVMFSAEDMNWGGDPKGQLATALRNARIKAKQPKKPLKIEKLGAEYEDCEVCYATVDKGTLNDVQAGRICNECHKMNQYEGGTKVVEERCRKTHR